MSDVAELGTTAAVESAAERVPEAQAPVAPGVAVVAQPPSNEKAAHAKTATAAVQDSRQNPAADDSDEDAPPRGRPPAHTSRTRRTAKDNWRKARTDAARKKAIIFARQNGLLDALDVEAIRWGLEQGLLTERQAALAIGMPVAPAAPAAQQQKAEQQPAAAAMPQAQPAGGPQPIPAGPTTTAAPQPNPPGQAAQPGATPPAAPPAPPQGPLFMGQPAERVAMFAGIALPVLDVLSKKLPGGFDPTAHTKATLFRGTPLEQKVDCVPLERMAELTGVVCAKRWPAAGGDADPSSQAKTELMVLGLATFGPALVTAGKRAAGALWTLGRGIGARVKARRGGAMREAAE